MDHVNLLIGLRSLRQRLDHAFLVMRDEDLTLQHAAVLLLIEEQPGIRAADIASKLGVEFTGASQVCKALDELGLVVRKRPTPVVLNLALTPRGKRIAAKVRAQLNELGHVLWGDLPKEILDGAVVLVSNVTAREPR